MKSSIAALLAISSAMAGFAAGAWTAIHNGWGASSSVVVANLLNETGQTIPSVLVLFETCGSRGIAVVGELGPGASRQVSYSVCGEAGYAVEATFADGRVLKGSGGYVEGGYVSTDRIQSEGVASTQETYARAL